MQVTLLSLLSLLLAFLAVPSTLDREYGYYERGPQIVKLQLEVGVELVDGVYGPDTRSAHIKRVGGAYGALRRWYPVGQRSAPATLGDLVDEYFQPEDQAWALRVAECESSTLPHHYGNAAVSPALAAGAFQNLAKYWAGRSEAAGFGGYDILDMRANVATAARLFYDSGPHHWNPSRSCWGTPL
jgi:hypothetical protein